MIERKKQPWALDHHTWLELALPKQITRIKGASGWYATVAFVGGTWQRVASTFHLIRLDIKRVPAEGGCSLGHTLLYVSMDSAKLCMLLLEFSQGKAYTGKSHFYLWLR